MTDEKGSPSRGCFFVSIYLKITASQAYAEPFHSLFDLWRNEPQDVRFRADCEANSVTALISLMNLLVLWW